jgi:hypothetical protein
MKIKFSFLFLFLFILLNFHELKGQDFIIKYKAYQKKNLVKDLSIQNDIIQYTNISDGTISARPIREVLNINFVYEGTYEIGLIIHDLETISCNVDSISAKSVFFSQGNGIAQQIPKGLVFYVQFGRLDNLSRYNVNPQNFIKSQSKPLSQVKKIIFKDGREVDILKIISLKNDRIDILVKSRGYETNTYINCSELTSAIFSELADLNGINSSREYILSSEGRFVPISVKKIELNHVKYSTIAYGNVIELEQQKESIAAIFFHDYTENKIESFAKENSNTNQKGELKFRAKFDFNMGMGYLLSIIPENATSENEDYLNEMRRGFTYDANLNIYFSNGFGIGAKYNHFSTKNSIGNLLEENVKDIFLGVSFLAATKLPNDRGILSTSLSIGSLSEVNDAKIYNYDVKIEGETIGIYLNVGLDFFVSDNIALGIHSGLIWGMIKKVEVNGQDQDLDEPMNLSRFDGLVGFKVYF